MIKKIIKIALYLVLLIGIFGVIMGLMPFNPTSVLASGFWLVVSAFFIERIYRGKLGKTGWILAGIFAFLGVALFGIGFIFGMILTI